MPSTPNTVTVACFKFGFVYEFIRLCVHIFHYFFSQESLCRAVGKGDWGVALRSTAGILFCFTDPDLEEEELFKDA